MASGAFFSVARGIALVTTGVLGTIFTSPAIASLEDFFPVETELRQTSTPSVPPLPGNVPEAITPDDTGILGLYPDPDDNIGIGQLRPKDVAALATPRAGLIENANWLRSAALPIFVEPDSGVWGWIINGWLLSEGNPPIAIGRDAAFSMLRTYYALFSFPVMEVREDGWFRFQYTPAGTAWAHVSHLNLGAVELTIEPWEERFLEVGQLEFLRHGTSQPLRFQPNFDERLVALVGPNSLIEPLEFEGEWMRVRVTQPANTCSPLPGASTSEGWMRWRNGSDRSLVWYPPKGC